MTAATPLSLTIAELAGAYRRRELGPSEVTRAAFDRIRAVDGQVHAFVTLTEDLAAQQAAQAEQDFSRGIDRGPLQGVPIGLKDLYATAGIRTTAHSRVLLDWIPAEDATAVSKLHQSGTVLLGKLAMHEFAWRAPGFDTAFPPARNPWDLERTPGGSSSGSGAALAARMCFGALGSDTGGSIRGPAHQCGITGLKTTYGLVSRFGVLPLSWSLDTCGPMARTAEDCALLLQAIAGYDERDAASAKRRAVSYTAGLGESVRGLRIGLPRSWLEEGDCDPEIGSAFEEALHVLRELGAQTVDVDGAPFSAARLPQTTIMLAEAYAYHEANLKARPQDYGQEVRDRLREAAFLSAADYIQAQRARSSITGRIADVLKQVDVVATPAAQRTAGRFEDYNPEAFASVTSYTGAFNLAGLPAICLPCGFSSEGLPIGLQLGGRPFEEPRLLNLGYAYQHVTTWHTREPILA